MLGSPFLTRIYTPEKVSETSTYPLNVTWLKHGEFDFRFSSPITLICGENGSGKSTFMESLADHCGFSLTGGSRNNLIDDKSSNHVRPLTEALRFVWSIRQPRGFFFRAESFYHFATHLDDLHEAPAGAGAYDAYGGKSLHQQSHGESFMSMLLNRTSAPGIYIFDEPEAALSTSRQLQLLALLYQIHKDGKSQVILASHSPMILSFPFAELYELSDGIFTKKRVQQTETYKTYARFFENPDLYFNELFRD